MTSQWDETVSFVLNKLRHISFIYSVNIFWVLDFVYCGPICGNSSRLGSVLWMKETWEFWESPPKLHMVKNLWLQSELNISLIYFSYIFCCLFSSSCQLLLFKSLKASLFVFFFLFCIPMYVLFFYKRVVKVSSTGLKLPRCFWLNVSVRWIKMIDTWAGV